MRVDIIRPSQGGAETTVMLRPENYSDEKLLGELVEEFGESVVFFGRHPVSGRVIHVEVPLRKESSGD